MKTVLYRALFCYSSWIAAAGCAAVSSTDTTCPPLESVTISIANEDASAPFSVMSVAIDGIIMYQGPVFATANGQYTYITTQLTAERGVVLTAASSTDDAEVVEEKEIWIKKGVWIIVTRENKISESPQLDISVSYENSAFTP